jgi:hypothetical protein
MSKKRCGIETFFSTTPYAAIRLLGTLLWKAVSRGCQKNVAVFKRFFSTTPYAAIRLLGTLLWKAVQNQYVNDY